MSTRGNRRSLRSATPDFLLVWVALAKFLRLSLLKAAHVATSSVAWQEIRVRSGRDDKERVSFSIKGDYLRWPPGCGLFAHSSQKKA